jgi:hypothetical protein
MGGGVFGGMLKKIADLEKMVHRIIVHHDEFYYWLKLMYILISVTPCINRNMYLDFCSLRSTKVKNES